MKLALYGILVVLALFIILMVFNPRLSCFGRKLKSPFYPVLRKKKQRQRQVKTMDYGFDLDSPGGKRSQTSQPQKITPNRATKTGKNIVAEDYGFDLHGDSRGKKQ
jgi:hypothetical protein